MFSLMEKNITKIEYTIDASGKRLGKVATEAASYLLGKTTTSQTRNNVSAVTVNVIHASKLDITQKKMEEIYQTYSGYPGGRKVETTAHLGKRRGYSEVVSRTVRGMLPKNKLQTLRMKNLIVTE